MTKEQALQLIDQVIRPLNLSRDMHLKLMEAISILAATDK